MGALGGLWAAYTKSMENNPMATRMITSAALNGMGDIIGQTVFNEGEAFDWIRFVKFSGLVRTTACCMRGCGDMHRP